MFQQFRFTNSGAWALQSAFKVPKVRLALSAGEENPWQGFPRNPGMEW